MKRYRMTRSSNRADFRYSFEVELDLRTLLTADVPDHVLDDGAG